MTSADMQTLVDASFSRLASDGMENLSTAQKVVVCVWGLLGEVGNGGFDQWLYNTSGDWAKPTLEALEALSAHEAAALVRSALAVFPEGGPSPDFDERHVQMRNLPHEAMDVFRSLDERFFKLDDDLDASLLEYALSHEAEILI